jgi:hypothetical protein
MSVSTSTTRTPNVEKQEWAHAADKAKEVAASAGEMANHAVSAVGAMANRTACELGRKADDLTAEAGHGIQELANKIGKHAPQTGVLGTASQALADTVRSSGEYVEEAKFRGITEDVSQLIRRHPIPAIVIAVGVGCYVGRKMGR